jgi:hypothetical protein
LILLPWHSSPHSILPFEIQNLMSNSPLLGIGFGLAAASSWGTGDFGGGLASKRTHVYGVVIVSQLVGLGLLITPALLLSEPVPAIPDMLRGGIAGVAEAAGLAAFYRGLATALLAVMLMAT